MSAQTASTENSASGISPGAPWRVKAMSVLPAYQLAITFQDGQSGIVDCSRIVGAADPGIFAPLANADFFAQARLELGAITWPNGADLDPLWAYEEVTSKKLWSVPF
ncbi:MAG: DUF2442 domain-containing protein [Rhodocyclaceae bacterium]|nr:DUF2442 domain-containing protein [Rhodocyclaceae bacterium]MBX3669004.1 DUF2442 domain-containing protein [Rhodocyclaceae bacterium]